MSKLLSNTVLNSSYFADHNGAQLVVFFDSKTARKGFEKAKALGMNPRELECPKYGNSSFVVC